MLKGGINKMGGGIPMVERQGESVSQRDYTNPTVLAVELTEMRGRLDFLGHGIDELKAAMSGIGDQIGSVISSQSEFRIHSSGLERVSKDISRYFADNDKWIDAHEIANQKVADQVTHWRGWIFGVMAMVAVLSAAIATIVNDGFARTDKEFARTDKELARREHVHEIDVLRLEKSLDRLSAEVKELRSAEQTK